MLPEVNAVEAPVHEAALAGILGPVGQQLTHSSWLQQDNSHPNCIGHDGTITVPITSILGLFELG